MKSPAETTKPSAAGGGLKRHIGTTGLLFVSVGSIIGSGWLFGALNAARTAGPAAIVSWALGAVMIALLAFVYAELGTMFPLSGGPVRYPHMAFGSFASYTTGWVTWIGMVGGAPIEVQAALQYATKYAPLTQQRTAGGEIVYTLTGLGYVVAALLLMLFVVVNYYGVRWFARVNNALVWWKLAIIVLVIITFFAVSFHGSNFHSSGFAPYGTHGVLAAIATSGIVFSYLGFQQGIELAGESKNPRRSIPICVLGSLAICGLLYIALQIAFVGALRPSMLLKSGSWANLQFAGDFGPLAGLATALGVGWLAVMLYIDAVISPGDSGLVNFTVSSRLSYAMSKNGNAPESLGKTTDRGVPFVSLIVAFVIGLVILLPFPSWQQLVGFLTAAIVLSYASGPLTLAAMRKQLPNQPRPFKLPGGHVVPFLAFWASNLIVFWVGYSTVWRLMVVVVIGLVLLGVSRLRDRTQPLDLRAGSWYLPWLVGLLVISYLGDFGGRHVIEGIWSLLAVFALSLAVYVMAQKMCLNSERVIDYINGEEVSIELATDTHHSHTD